MEDVDYLRLLRDGIGSGLIHASLNFRKLEHIDSPISVQADSNRWIYGLIVIVASAGWLGGVWWAVGAGLAGGLAWFAIGRPWHRRRMEQRFHQAILHDLGEWKRLWRMEGVTLIDVKTGAECTSPSGNWRVFVGSASKSGAEVH